MLKDRQYKCPVCGAPVEGFKCEYCGCVIYDFAVIDTDQPTYLRIRINNPTDGHDYIMQMKAIAVNPCVEIKRDETQFCDMVGNCLQTFTTNQICTMSVEFQAVSDDKDVLFTLIDADRPYRESWRDDIECCS